VSFKVLNEKVEPKKYVYPLVYKSKITGLVVLFTAPKTGLALSSNETHYFGKFQDGWVAHTDTKTWEPINISIQHP